MDFVADFIGSIYMFLVTELDFGRNDQWWEEIMEIIVVFVWQLNLYSNALLGTLLGFGATYIIMSVVGYRITKKEVDAINLYLGQN